MLASSPVASLNHKIPEKGIPRDSLKSGKTLGRRFLFPDIRSLASQCGRPKKRRGTVVRRFLSLPLPRMAPDGRAQHFDTMDNCGKICWLMPRKLRCFADIGPKNACHAASRPERPLGRSRNARKRGVSCRPGGRPFPCFPARAVPCTGCGAAPAACRRGRRRAC